MSCHKGLIKLRQASPDFVPVVQVILIPVFCACLISVIGSSVGMRHAIFMQFEIRMDTEFISVNSAMLLE